MYVQDVYKTRMLITCINLDPPVPRFGVPTLQRYYTNTGRTQARIPFLWVVAFHATLLYLQCKLYWTCAYASQGSFIEPCSGPSFQF